MSLSRFLLIISIAIPLHMNAQTVSRILSHGTLHIELNLIPVDIPDSEWDSNYSIALTRAIKRDNLPREVSIVFDKHRYRKEQVDQEWGWKGKSIELFDLKSEAGSFCKSHPLLDAYIPFSPALPAEEIGLEEVDEPVIELLDEQKEILGLSCRKAQWTSDEAAWEVWYAEKVEMADELEFIWGLPGIPGLIVEMAERPEKGQVSVRQYKVKSCDETAPGTDAFEIPTGYHPYENSYAARKAVLELLQKSFSDIGPDIHRVEGPWKLEGFPDEIYLKVEVQDGKPVLIKEIGAGDATLIPVSVGNDQVLQVNGLEFKLYQVSKNGKELEEVGKSAFHFRKAKSRKLRKAGIDFE